MDSLTQLLENVRIVRSKLEGEIDARKESGELFNVFDLCCVGHYETIHSSILAEFLSPVGSHGMGAEFLQMFAKQFDLGEYSKNAEVKTELSEKIGGESIGRFDILIQDESTHHVCIVENKIFAGEQRDQLERYGHWLDQKEKDGWKTRLAFLTLDGHESVTAGECRDYVRLAYFFPRNPGERRNDVVGWLRECATRASEKASVSNALSQYADHLENLATGERAMSKAIVEKLLSNMKAAEDVYNNYVEACIHAAEIILVEDVTEMLRQRAVQWRAVSACSWKFKDCGVLYVPPEGGTLKGQIFVLFDGTQLDGCEIVLRQEKDSDRQSPIRIDEEQKMKWEGQGWNVDCEEGSKDPLWRPVCYGAKDPNALQFGLHWDGKFFDAMNSDREYRKAVVAEIVKGIEDLYEIQKELSKDDSSPAARSVDV